MEIPTYAGTPLSLLRRVTEPDSTIPLWLWGTTQDTRENTAENRESLAASGYQQVPSQYSDFLKTALFSQLCEAVYLTDDQPKLWAKASDLAHVKQHPVILAFSLEPNTDSDTLAMLQFLPLPHMGEYAIINSSKELTIYNIAQLPEAVQERWKMLNIALRNLAAPSQWVPHTTQHQYCSDELSYHRHLTDMRGTSLKGKKPERDQAREFLAQLEDAHQQVTALHESWLKQDWLVQWKEITRMAQELAADYCAYHQNITSTGNKPIPDIANVFQMGIAEIFTHQPFQAYAAATIARSGEWQQVPAEKENELILSYQRTKPSGTTYVQIREEITGNQSRETALANMWEQTKKLSDLDADVYLAMVAQMLKGIKDEQGNTWITAQQVLSYRGIQPKINKAESGSFYIGGHRWEDIEIIAACIKRMENVVIKVHEQEIIDDHAPTNNKRKRPRKTISLSSRLFMFGDTIDHKTLPLDGSPKAVTIAWQYRQSSWMVPFLEGSNRFTGLLFQKVLNYDPYHEKWEKRLSRHFMFWLRTNASHEKKPAITIGELLHELNLETDERFPQRTRDRFEKAMDRITADGLLTWDYKEKIELPARKWLPTWLQQHIIVEDPPVLKSQYMSIEAAAKIVRAENRVPRQNRQKRASDEGKND